MSVAFQIHAQDNVGVLLEDGEPGAITVRGPEGERPLELREKIVLGHKVALLAIGQGEAIVKYGATIGHATRPIDPGDWVHLHNCASNYDERSGSLDVNSGAPSDTRYG